MSQPGAVHAWGLQPTQKFWEKLNKCVFLLGDRNSLWKNMDEIILNSDIHNRLLSTAENRKAHRLWPTQSLPIGSVQLGQIVGQTAS